MDVLPKIRHLSQPSLHLIFSLLLLLTTVIPALAGSKPVPSFGCGAVFWNTLAVLVQGPKIVLGGGVALRGQFLPEQKRLSVTPAGVSGGGIFVGPGQSGR